jgi:hypothetical protein
MDEFRDPLRYSQIIIANIRVTNEKYDPFLLVKYLLHSAPNMKSLSLTEYSVREKLLEGPIQFKFDKLAKPPELSKFTLECLNVLKYDPYL